MTNLPASLSCLFLLLATALPAQQCSDFGSQPVPQQFESSPFLLGCPAAPTWPMWHLLTPAHDAPAPHVGFSPGDADARPRLLVDVALHGLVLLLPVLPSACTTNGYVIDQPETPCTRSRLEQRGPRGATATGCRRGRW
jgi:hypothetical protein